MRARATLQVRPSVWILHPCPWISGLDTLKEGCLWEENRRRLAYRDT